MQTRFFRFPDMQTAFDLASAAGLTATNDQGQSVLVRHSHSYSLDVIGVIHHPTGRSFVVDGAEFPEMAPVPGWHVNVRTDQSIPAELLPFEVFPATPCRDFA